MKLQVRTYDPRLGQNYAVPNHATKKTFSSLEHSFFVLDCIGAVDWIAQLPLLNGCVGATSKKLFLMLDPWEPGARELRKALEREFGHVREFERSLCGYATIGSDAAERVLRLRASFGGDKTGEWCIGGCLEEFASPVRMSFFKGHSWGMPLVLEQSEKLGCVVSLGEMQQSLLVTRLFDGLDNLLHQSSQHLSA